jgi:hypothetical protein
MTKLLTLVTLVGSLLVAGVASADPAPRADGDRTERPRQLRAGDGGCVGKRHGKQLEKGKRTGKRMNKRGPGDRHPAPDRGRRGPRQGDDQPDRRDA